MSFRNSPGNVEVEMGKLPTTTTVETEPDTETDGKLRGWLHDSFQFRKETLDRQLDRSQITGMSSATPDTSPSANEATPYRNCLFRSSGYWTVYHLCRCNHHVWPSGRDTLILAGWARHCLRHAFSGRISVRTTCEGSIDGLSSYVCRRGSWGCCWVCLLVGRPE
jgi:hypothetical protein